MFLTIWLVGLVLSFIASRIVVKLAIKDDEKFFDKEIGLLAMLYIAPFIPIINYISILVMIVAYVAFQVDKYGATKVAQKLFFIRGEKREKAKEGSKKIDKIV